jgi:hypothetical protein
LSLLVGDSVAIVLVTFVYLLRKNGLEATGVSLAVRRRIGVNASIQLLLSNV